MNLWRRSLRESFSSSRRNPRSDLRRSLTPRSSRKSWASPERRYTSTPANSAQYASGTANAHGCASTLRRRARPAARLTSLPNACQPGSGRGRATVAAAYRRLTCCRSTSKSRCGMTDRRRGRHELGSGISGEYNKSPTSSAPALQQQPGAWHEGSALHASRTVLHRLLLWLPSSGAASGAVFRAPSRRINERS